MTMNKYVWMAVWLTACARGLNSGESECGNVTCAAGQYCLDPTFDDCTNGCVSDANCAGDSVCTDIDFGGEGICSESTAPGTPVTPRDGLQECLAACDLFGTCGLPVADVAQCRDECPTLSENEQLAVAGCNDSSCTNLPTCLGVDCLSTDDCGGGEVCLDYTCL